MQKGDVIPNTKNKKRKQKARKQRLPCCSYRSSSTVRMPRSSKLLSAAPDFILLISMSEGP